MPRPPRADEAGAIYHALNRGNSRQEIYRKDADYEAFERVLADGFEKHPVDLFAYQWMPNHWHMVLSPREDGVMSRLLYWITMTHSQRYHAHYHTVGEEHVYQWGCAGSCAGSGPNGTTALCVRACVERPEFHVRVPWADERCVRKC